MVCVIPDDVSKRTSVADVVRHIWENNNLNTIALHPENKRPDTLYLEYQGSHATSSSYSSQLPLFISQINWPVMTEGYLQINGAIKKLTRVIHAENAENAVNNENKKTKQLDQKNPLCSKNFRLS